MDTKALEKFAQAARRQLIDEVGSKLEQVLQTDSAELREKAAAIQELRDQIAASSKQAVIDRVAYTWFNRFCALRFMDANHYTRVGAVSPLPGHTQPEILQDAKQGHIPDELDRFMDAQQVFALLSGELPSWDPQQEAYRLLLVAVCNQYQAQMPFMFEKIADYTELLMPDDLLSEESILYTMRQALTPEVCEDVEAIGWLYQYYISEKKAEVDAKVKKGGKVNAEEIPAKTALFTPHWIVRYLLENSLGRLWMLNHQQSRLVERMDYYIDNRDLPDGEKNQDTDFLHISSPEEIKVCDPACGSGHMLVYAFDLLYAIYEEQGYDPREIPTLILSKNLYGIEIDERAGELAAFALVMKARARDPKFLSRDVSPRICVLENISFMQDELERYINRVGRHLFTADLRETLEEFAEAKHFGSLIRPTTRDVTEILRVLREKNVGGDIFLSEVHQRVLKVLDQANYLASKYHVVVANPPYLGKAMNGRLKEFAKKQYPDTKTDLFAMLIVRGLEMVVRKGYGAMVTMQSWMFLSSYEKLRSRLMKSTAIVCMSHMANMVMGIAFGTAATVWRNGGSQATRGAFCYIEYEDLGSQNAPVCFPPDNSRNVKAGNGGFFRASAADLKKIPGAPIAYWIKNTRPFDGPRIRDAFESGGRTKTHGNETYLRYWWEVARQSSIWAPYANGGDYRKYAGNDLQVVNWSSAATSFYDSHGGLYPQKYWYKEGITWGLITSARTSFRLKSSDAHYSSGAPTIFQSSFSCDQVVLGFLNSPIAYLYLKAINPTLNTTVNDVLGLPLPARHDCPDIDSNVGNGIALSRTDWDAYERSWDFQSLPILTASSESTRTLESSYTSWIAQNRDTIAEMKRLEEENNRLFIDAYGLQDELTPDVPLEEITLTVNPAYRYGGKLSEEDQWTRFRKDTMDEFISYGVDPR